MRSRDEIARDFVTLVAQATLDDDTHATHRVVCAVGTVGEILLDIRDALTANEPASGGQYSTADLSAIISDERERAVRLVREWWFTDPTDEDDIPALAAAIRTGDQHIDTRPALARTMALIEAARELIEYWKPAEHSIGALKAERVLSAIAACEEK